MRPIDDIRAMQAAINKLPPMPRCIMASHLVPYGRAYRQWNTRGELIVWANRGEIADLPRVPRTKELLVVDLLPASSWGTPPVVTT